MSDEEYDDFDYDAFFEYQAEMLRKQGDVEKNFVCEDCGAAVTDTPNNLYDQGWDTWPRFTTHTTCPNCVITTTQWFKDMTGGSGV